MPLRLIARLLTIEADALPLARNSMRTGLAVLALTFGVATVIWVVAIGRAGTASAIAALDNLGDNLVWIEAGSRNSAGVRTGTHGMTTLVAQDAEAIRDQITSIAKVSENVDGRVQVIYGDSNWNTMFRGISPAYLDIRKWKIARGEFITDEHTQHADSVVVIGDTVRRQLFGDDDPLGAKLRIAMSSFTVVGVLAPKGASATGQDQDDTIMMPWTTARRRIVGKDITWLDDILCSATSTDEVARAAGQVSELLRERHHLEPGIDDDFNIRHPEELLKAKIKSATTLERLLLAIASLAMLVGGIGIMNVMLASVAQRTNEIGLRMAIGARPVAIQVQFVGEAVMLAMVGGGLGVLLGDVAGPIIGRTFQWELATSTRTDVIAFAFSIVIGIFFGFYPAIRAARLDPIEALRVES